MPIESGTGPSQLTTNKYIIYNGIEYTSEEFMNFLLTRNEFNINVEYDEQNSNLSTTDANSARDNNITYNGKTYTFNEFNKIYLDVITRGNEYSKSNEYGNKENDLSTTDVNSARDNNITYDGKTYTFEEFNKTYLEIITRGNKYNFNTQYQDVATSGAGNSLRFKNDFANSVLDVIPQYNSLGVSNSLLSRGITAAVDGTTALTPLEQIGTVMLGKQMFYNSVAHLAQQNLPTINVVGSIFNGENLFQFPVDYSITNLASVNWVDKLVSKSFYRTNIIGEGNPFTKDSTNGFYIENTGKGQLKRFYESINLNLYKGVSNYKNKEEGNTEDERTLIEYSEKKGIKVALKYQNVIIQNKTFFNFNDKLLHPYLLGVNKYFTEKSVNDGNVEMRISYLTPEQQYAPTIEYINTNFGKTDKTDSIIDRDNYIKNNNNDDVQNKLVWGRDGVSKLARENLLSSLNDDYSNEIINANTNSHVDFNIKGGLLEYTRNLLNASSGFLVDITKKIYKDGDKIVGFNGSPVWQRNSTTYSNSNFGDRTTGIRQHNAVDKYDKFTKAIRFNGNTVYGGNQNSVIFDSVLPKIHPIFKDDKINNKNMMFSIENLAVLAIKDTQKNIGIINDEYGSQIPISEVGPFNGRIMWFPPYDLQLNESANAKYDFTVMVGRNEPIYTYMNSERTANLTFTLLVDYPQHLFNYIKNENYKSEIAKFFAFGGDNINEKINTDGIEPKIKDLERQIKELEGETTPIQEEGNEPNEEKFSFYFENAEPSEGNIETIFDTMYRKGYEVVKELKSTVGNGNSDGLNKDIYYLVDLIEDLPNVYELESQTLSQYAATGRTNPLPVEGDCKLNKALYEIYNNENYRTLYSIKIEAGTSLLGNSTDNQKLSDRRIEAVKHLITRRLETMFSNNNEFISTIFDNKVISNGENSAKATDGDKIENINKVEVKEDRSATITIYRNGNSKPNTKSDKNPNEDKIKELKKQKEELESELNKLKYYSNLNSTDNIFNERTKESKAIFDTFESVKTNHYQPAYHSQTPEDFHRRLTFLQQCTRQGSAKRFDMVEENGVLRAKNSVFGRQPICVLRVGDFFYTKVIIENVTVDYNDTTWDMNPEGFGMQPMIAKVTLQMKVMGGQSLSGPIDALQNAVSFNYYANSTFTDKGMYSRPSKVAADQSLYMNGVLAESRASLEGAVAERNINNTINNI